MKKICKNYKNVFNGFTLAEVLITLAIIGVVTALTIPTVLMDSRKSQYHTQFKKAYSQLMAAYNSTKFDMGGNPACFYWSSPEIKRKYASYETVNSTLERVDTDGDGINDKYVSNLNGQIGGVPADWNGLTRECTKQEKIFLSKLKILAVCKDERKKGEDKKNCAPYYKGSEELIEESYKNTNKNNYNNLSDEEKRIMLGNALQGNGLKESVVNKGTVYYLADGTILMRISTTVYAIDINGKKGPNKWGHDAFSFKISGDPTGRTNKFDCFGTSIENPKSNGGGYSCQEMIERR